jgi:hypothetical protein
MKNFKPGEPFIIRLTEEGLAKCLKEHGWEPVDVVDKLTSKSTTKWSHPTILGLKTLEEANKLDVTMRKQGKN